jgi:hypothetical protein
MGDMSSQPISRLLAVAISLASRGWQPPVKPAAKIALFSSVAGRVIRTEVGQQLAGPTSALLTASETSHFVHTLGTSGLFG